MKKSLPPTPSPAPETSPTAAIEQNKRRFLERAGLPTPEPKKESIIVPPTRKERIEEVRMIAKHLLPLQAGVDEELPRYRKLHHELANSAPRFIKRGKDRRDEDGSLSKLLYMVDQSAAPSGFHEDRREFEAIVNRFSKVSPEINSLCERLKANVLALYAEAVENRTAAHKVLLAKAAKAVEPFILRKQDAEVFAASLPIVETSEESIQFIICPNIKTGTKQLIGMAKAVLAEFGETLAV